jgi:hypothetical protein
LLVEGKPIASLTPADAKADAKGADAKGAGQAAAAAPPVPPTAATTQQNGALQSGTSAEARAQLEAMVSIPQVPKAKPAAERRYQAAATLQTSGELSRAQLFAFFTGTLEMVEDPSTHKRMLAHGKVKELGELLLQWQLEVLESQGVDREFGTSQMQPQSVFARFPDDEELKAALQAFVSGCGKACWAAALELRRRANVDAKARTFAAAAKLQEEGELERGKLLALIRGLAVMLKSGDTKAAMVAKEVKAREEAAASQSGQSAEGDMDDRMERLQREYAEHVGVGEDLCMGTLDALGERADAGVETDDVETRKAYGTFRAARAALRAGVEEAASLGDDGKQINMMDAKWERFAKADKLQADGKMSRAQVLRFSTGIVAELMKEEALQQFAKLPDDKAGQLSVLWQRQYLQSIGIEQEFGCRQLSLVPMRFKDDQEVQRAFKAFQTACVASIQKAQMLRASQGGSDADADAGPPPDPKNLRFTPGTKVKCRTAPSVWTPGVIVAQNYREPHFPPGVYAAYQVKLADDRLIFAPQDDDVMIKRA